MANNLFSGDLGLCRPILQAPIGSMAGVELAAAVSNAGGLGSLRNSTLQAWEAAGCPPVGARPGEGDVLAASAAGRTILRYDDTPAAQDMDGDLEACIQYAGLGCGKIHDVPTVADLIPVLSSRG
jgi:NAD(P)H-dependent flavin oxidoreductase YrpB (nitropropane dioxygenase family)